MQQAGEHVVYAHVQRHGGRDVVGLAAVQDLAGLKQHQTGHQQHEQAGYCERQRGHLKEVPHQAEHKGGDDADG